MRRIGAQDPLDEVEDLEDHDFISYFIEDMEAYGKSSSTLYEYERVLRDFDDFTDTHHARASRRDCMGYISDLRSRGLSASTVSTYASYLHRFYSYLVKADEFPHSNNPMALVTEEMSEGIDKNPQRRELSVTDVTEFLKTVNHPRDRCILVTLFKTGMRAGELSNLKLEDISLTTDLDDEFGLGGNARLSRNSLLVVSDRDGNKRLRDTLIPIDDELRKELVRWLRVRPENGSSRGRVNQKIHERLEAEASMARKSEISERPETDSDAVFVSLSRASETGSLSPEAVSSLMRKYTQPYGWWEEGRGLEENVTPHYCRHFFTTHLREASGDDALVKYLRGDVGGDVIETYTHQWGDNVRESYEKYIYRLVS
ncbi:tyrosine-type recombinase/integrase [Halorutilales archaeon Cl-col2-1]